MNRLFILTFSVILLTGWIKVLHSQPDWVKDLVTNPPPLPSHEEANVHVLHDEANIKISSKSAAKIKLRVAYQIINSEGEEYGSINLPVSPHMKVKRIKGWIYDETGEFSDLPKENIVEFGSLESSAYYDESRTLTATLPGVKPGVIVAFEAEVEDRDWTSLFQQFIFQRDQAVAFTRYSITIPEDWQLFKSEWLMEGIEFSQEGNSYTWFGKNLPFREKEPLSPSWFYLSRRVVVSCYDPDNSAEKSFHNWSDVSKWCAQVYENPAVPLDDIIETTNKVCAKAKSFDDQVFAIADFIQSQIRYVAIEIGKERWEPRPAAGTLFNRYGDCKDKTTLMRAMLKAQNISSIPVLAHTRASVDKNLPSPFQFNHCIIAISIPDESKFIDTPYAVVDNWLFFDPTDETIPPGELPSELQGSRVLLGIKKDSTLIRLPRSQSKYHKKVRHLRGEIRDDGSYTAEVTITHTGEWASNQRYMNKLVSTRKQVEIWKRQFFDVLPGLDIINLKTNDHTDSLTMSFMITGQHLIQKSGDFIILHPDVFRIAEAPKLTKLNRQHPVWFGQPQEIETYITWRIPEQWITQQDSIKIQETCKGASLLMKTRCSPGILRHHSLYQQAGRLMNSEEYAPALEFSRKLSMMESHAVLFTL